MKKAQEIAQRIQEYESKREAEKRVKSIHSVFVNKMRKKIGDPRVMP